MPAPEAYTQAAENSSEEKQRPAPRHALWLTRSIYLSLMSFSAVVLIIATIALTCVYYYSDEYHAEEQLLSQAESAAEALSGLSDDQQTEALASQLEGSLRYTLISSDGTVLFDNVADNVDELENHADRPEFQAAKTTGGAVCERHSKTLGTDTVYAAVELDSDNVLRLAQDRESVVTFLERALLPLLAIIIVSAIIVNLFSRKLSERIMRPINELDVANPLDCEAYTELMPLLERIGEQQSLLKKQNAELARSEQRRRDFTSNVSHDMKTPVHVISGYAELMKDGDIPIETVHSFSSAIYDEAQTLRSLIDDVLTLSRLDEVGFELKDLRIIDLRSIIDRVVARLDILADEHEVSLQIAPTLYPVPVLGNEALLEEMLANLVENAIRYNNEGGSVTVSAALAGGWALLAVADDGPGIPKSKQERIFERFYRLEKSRSKETGGTGLGLAIVKHIAQRHEGSVSVKSTEGEGSTFTVRLPMYVAE